MLVGEKHILDYTMTKEQWEDLGRQKRAEKKGRSLGRLGLVGLKRVLRESVATEDEARRYGLVRGYSESLSERDFPTPRTDALSRSAMSAVNAQWRYAHGIEKVLTEAVSAARESRDYRRLDIPQFINPPQRSLKG